MQAIIPLALFEDDWMVQTLEGHHHHTHAQSMASVPLLLAAHPLGGCPGGVEDDDEGDDEDDSLALSSVMYSGSDSDTASTTSMSPDLHPLEHRQPGVFTTRKRRYQQLQSQPSVSPLQQQQQQPQQQHDEDDEEETAAVNPSDSVRKRFAGSSIRPLRSGGAGGGRGARVRNSSGSSSGSGSESSDSSAADRVRASVSSDGAEDVDVQQLLVEQETKRRRLARKAELARISRHRKKVLLTDLEEENRKLQQTVDDLRKAHQKVLEERDQAALVSQLRMVEGKPNADAVFGDPETPVADCEVPRINQLVQELGGLVAGITPVGSSPQDDGLKLESAAAAEAFAVDEQLAAQLLTKTQEFEAAQQHRHRVMQFMCNSLEQGLQQPSLPVRFFQWILFRSDRFYQDPQGLWHSLTQEELRLSAEQVLELQRLRQRLQTSPEQRGVEAMEPSCARSLLAHVKDLVEQESWLGAQMTKLFSPAQFSRYCAFVTRFGAVCMKIDA